MNGTQTPTHAPIDLNDVLRRFGREAILDAMVRDAARDHEGWELGGLQGETPDPYTLLCRDLALAMNETRQLARHVHEWNADRYCAICGADGCA